MISFMLKATSYMGCCRWEKSGVWGLRPTIHKGRKQSPLSVKHKKNSFLISFYIPIGTLVKVKPSVVAVWSDYLKFSIHNQDRQPVLKVLCHCWTWLLVAQIYPKSESLYGCCCRSYFHHFQTDMLSCLIWIHQYFYQLKDWVKFQIFNSKPALPVQLLRISLLKSSVVKQRNKGSCWSWNNKN